MPVLFTQVTRDHSSSKRLSLRGGMPHIFSLIFVLEWFFFQRKNMLQLYITFIIITTVI